MATSTPGIGSGLDVNSIVNQLVAVERQPLQKLPQRATVIQTQVSSWGKLKSLLDTLNSSVAKLATASTWNQTTISSADPAALSATVKTGSAASPGRYSVQVAQLAQEQSVASGVIAAGADMRGRLIIEIGSYDGGVPPGFTPRTGSTALQLDFTAVPTSLAEIRNAINGANAGVRATILNDGAGQRLVLSGSETGQDQAFRVSASDPAGTGATGLAALTFDAGPTSAMAQTRAARDASFSVNGVSLTSPRNTIDSTIEGITFQLLKPGTTTDITVEPDSAAQRKLLEEFAAAYNAVNNQIATDTGYDGTTRKGGPLFGDSGALAVRRLLRDMIGQSSTASSVYSRLSDLGLDIQRDGTISLNSSKLDTALRKPAELAKILSAPGSGIEESKGLGVRLKALMEPLLGDSGIVDIRSESLRERLKRNQTDQERINDRIEVTRQRLLRQYQALDGRVTQLNGLGNYVAQQFSPRG